LALAVLAAFLTAFKVGPGGVERRSTAVGAATSQILVDSAESTLVEGAGSDQLAALGTRASVYAQYLSSRDAVVQIARDMHVNPALVTAFGPFSQGTGIQTYDQQGAESRASALVDEGKSYRLVFQAQEDVPIITVYATAPTAAGAVELAHSSYRVLTGYIANLKREAKVVGKNDTSPQPVVASTVPLINDIIVRQLGRPEGGLVGGSANLVLMILAFVAVLGLGCLAFAVGSGFMRHWRLAAEMDRFDTQTRDWSHEPPADPTLAPAGGEREKGWRLLHPGDDDPRDSEHESGPAVSGR
jgi:hypothetical protein